MRLFQSTRCVEQPTSRIRVAKGSIPRIHAFASNSFINPMYPLQTRKQFPIESRFGLLSEIFDCHFWLCGRHSRSMIKALLLIFAPERVWERIFRAPRSIGAILLTYLLPLLLISSLAEGYGLV